MIEITEFVGLNTKYIYEFHFNVILSHCRYYLCLEKNYGLCNAHYFRSILVEYYSNYVTMANQKGSFLSLEKMDLVSTEVIQADSFLFFFLNIICIYNKIHI